MAKNETEPFPKDRNLPVQKIITWQKVPDPKPPPVNGWKLFTIGLLIGTVLVWAFWISQICR